MISSKKLALPVPPTPRLAPIVSFVPVVAKVCFTLKATLPGPVTAAKSKSATEGLKKIGLGAGEDAMLPKPAPTLTV